MTGLAGDEQARVSGWLLEELPAALPGWLPRQRWFAGKSRAIGIVGVGDIIWLGDPPRTALLLIEVDYERDLVRSGARERYALLLGLDAAAPPGSIGPLPWPPHAGVVDAGTTGLRDLLAAMDGAVGGAGLRGGVLERGDVGRETLPRPAGRAVEITPVGAEQSNTSARIGRSHSLKLLRRLHAGEHPQLEIARHLTRAAFAAAPRLDGSLTYVSPDGSRCAIAVLEAWVDNEGDGWSFVLHALAQAASRDERGPLASELFTLGAVTADFHATLAAATTVPAFAPEPISMADAAAWRDRVIAHGEQVMAIVGAAQRRWDGEAASLARQLLHHQSRVADLVGALDLTRSLAAARKIRVHGDYHLGQTLKTSSGFVLIDFEGEPSRPLEERRQKDCALKDVAGMLRSLDYAAAASASRGAPVRAGVQPMRLAFLDGYYSDARTAGFLPSREDAAPLLWLFELEKALYEVDYEMNNRPDWVAIPLTAVIQLLRDAAPADHA